MGSSHSTRVLTSPALYATPLVPHKPDNTTSRKKYDYIIVGGGTAGCVLASRLSEDASVTVLLLEAGKSSDSNLLTRIPLAFSKLFKTQADWDFETLPQSELNGRSVYWPRGKILGGTSAINALVFHHCAPQDFDQWEKLGAEGWSYENLQPYFRKAEKYKPSSLLPKMNVPERGRNGPLHTGHGDESAPIMDIIKETYETLGIQDNPYVNTPHGTNGFVNFIGTLDGKGQRDSTATAYLTADVLARPNLTVAVDTMVERIVFDLTGAEPRATGVEISTSPGSPRYCATATREVVLCAGAVGSPQLLLLSGLGPAKELADKNVPLVKDLPAVGKNLSDHVVSGPINLRAKAGLTWDYLFNPIFGTLAMVKWYVFGKGPLSTLITPSAAFIRSDDPQLPLCASNTVTRDDDAKDLSSGADSPDIEVVWAPFLIPRPESKATSAETSGMTFIVFALKPESTGQITLKSSSIWDKPVIDPCYLKCENDIKILVRGIRFCMNLARTEPLKSALYVPTHPSNASDILWPGEADPEEVSDEELKAWLRNNASSNNHQISTNRIGRDPSSSVVDSNLRVHGVTGLRVVDASIFPAQVSGHPCAVVIALAERAADLIKAN